MSVILEFTIDAEGFELGDVLAGPPAMHLELERIVPTGHVVMPFVWATGDDHADFERSVRDHPAVEELAVLDSLGDSALYRIEWVGAPTDLLKGFAAADAVVLDARGDGRWEFRLRFPDHDALSHFHNFVIEHGIDVHIERTYTLTEPTEHGYRFGLSQEQREALVLALQRGYFETPSEASLEDIADELGITRQAISDRLRRGNERILRRALLSSADDFA